MPTLACISTRHQGPIIRYFRTQTAARCNPHFDSANPRGGTRRYSVSVRLSIIHHVVITLRTGNGEKNRLLKSLPARRRPEPASKLLSRTPSAPLTNSTRSTRRRRRETSARTSEPRIPLFITHLTHYRDHEAEFLQKQTDFLGTGTTWERICELIELQNSQSKTLARAGQNTTDLTRFKEVLLRLKREGDAAPGAAGY